MWSKTQVERCACCLFMGPTIVTQPFQDNLPAIRHSIFLDLDDYKMRAVYLRL